MAGESSFFQASNGWKLHVEAWRPVEEPRAAMVFFHGVNESAQTLTCRRLSAALVAEGIAFHCVEQHGHGLSLERGGRQQVLGLIEGYDLLRTHAVEACRHVAESYGGRVPIVICGHSMGGATAVCATKAASEALANIGGNGARLAAAVYLAPAVNLCDDVYPGPATRFALRCVSFVSPALAIGPVEDPQEYCPPDVACPGRNYAGKWRARTTLAILDLPEKEYEAHKKAGDLDFGGLPFLVVRGARDVVVNIDGCKELVSRNRQGQLLELPEADHQPIAVGSGWEKVVSDVVAWVRGALTAR